MQSVYLCKLIKDVTNIIKLYIKQNISKIENNKKHKDVVPESSALFIVLQCDFRPILTDLGLKTYNIMHSPILGSKGW